MKRSDFIKLSALAGLGLGMESFVRRGKTHILTLSFDDGFKKLFYRIAEIYAEYDNYLQANCGYTSNVNVYESC